MLNAAGSATPQGLGTAAAGTSVAYSREDHVHALPTLSGDVTNTGTAVTVAKIQGSPVSASAPGSGQVLTWDGTQWAPAQGTGGGGGGGANGLTYYLNQATAADAPTTGITGTPHQLGRSGESAQTTLTSGSLTQNVWTLLAGFVSESTPIDPDVTLIPAGLWDFNVWAFGDANTNAGTSIRCRVYKYNGTTLTEIASPSSDQVINGTSAQYSLSVLIPQTTLQLTDRIYVAIEARATGSNHNVTLQFGDSTPSHVHTSLPLVGGTGLWKSIAGVLQSPASLLVNADVDAAAGIAWSKIAAMAGTDYQAPIGTISGIVKGNGANALTAAVAADVATLLGSQTAATVYAAPAGAAGTAQFRALTTTDIPGLDAEKIISGILPTARGGTGTTAGITAINTTQIASLTTAQTANLIPQLTTSGLLSLTQMPTIPVANGGTGATNASNAKVNLEVPLKGYCKYATTTALPTNTAPTALTLTATANGALSVDGVAVSVGDRILVKDEAGQQNNGIYDVTVAGSGSAAWSLTRSTDFNQGFEVNVGDIVPILLGSTLANTFWIQKSDVSTIGTDVITFVSSALGGILPVTKGGTGATDAATARANLGITGGTPTDVQVFYAPGGTWTKLAGAKSVQITLVAGGGGGGSGRASAPGTAAGGGGGGAGGGRSFITIEAALLGATEPVTVGSGGAGGAAQTVGNNGAAGGIGGASSFGLWLSASPTIAAGGGTSGGGGAAGSAGTRALNFGSSGGAGSGTFVVGSGGVNSVAASGGGAGGGVTTGGATSSGGTGGFSYQYNGIAVTAAQPGANGPSVPTGSPYGSGGGGGGTSSVTANAMAGGNGGNYGGGGGGGGASQGFSSGAGGNGANGIVIVTTYF